VPKVTQPITEIRQSIREQKKRNYLEKASEIVNIEKKANNDMKSVKEYRSFQYTK